MAAEDYEQVTYNSPTGAMIGQSATEKVGFFGATPVVQVAMTVTVGTDITTVIPELAEIRAALVSLGLIDS